MQQTGRVMLGPNLRIEDKAVLESSVLEHGRRASKHQVS